MEGQWGFLASWCQVLQGEMNYMGSECSASPFMERSLCVWLPERDHLEGVTRGVDISDADYEDLFRKQFQKTREAMALLAAVAHVDYDAWRFLLEKLCGVDFGQEGGPIYEKKIPVRYVVALDQRDQSRLLRGYHDVETHEFDIVFFFGVHQRLHPSEEYREALQRIAALDKNPLREKSGFDFDVPVRVDFGAPEDADVMKELMDVAIAEKIVKKQWQKFVESGENQAVASGEWRCTFVMDRAIVNLIGHELTPAVGPTIKTLLHQNAWFSMMSLGFESQLMASAQCYGQVFSSVFGGTRRSLQLANTSCHPGFEPVGESSDPLQLGEIGVNWDSRLQTHHAAALCSAMVHNQMSKNLSLRLWMNTYSPDTNKEYWKWLAYALFSKRASSTVESLALMKVCSMNLSEMEAFTSILRSEHPEEDLFGVLPGPVKSRRATLNAGTLVRCVLGDRNEVTETLAFDAAVPCVRTFSDDGSSTWIDCIVPGYGRCQVQRSDLVFDGDGGDDDTPSRGEAISSLRLGFNKQTPPISDGIMHLFAAVGSSLRYLSLDVPRRELPMILRYCPNLEELSLCGEVVDARLSFSGYHERGKALPELSANWDSVSAIATVLANNDNELTKCTRRVRVRFMDSADEVGISVDLREHERRVRTDFAALLDMLTTNQFLEYLEVVVPPAYDQYLQNFRSHHLEPIWRALNPFPLRSKLAFLSICTCTLGSNSSVARPKRPRAQPPTDPTSPLNPHVLANIFEFAAESVLREVYFRKSHRIKSELIHDELCI